MTSRPLRLLFYSHNGVGLGHFRRQLRLASAFHQRWPDSVVVLATGSHATRAFRTPPGIQIVQLPPIRKVGRYEAWAPRQEEASIDEVVRVRAQLLLEIVHRVRPDLLIADHMPAGPNGELIPALEQLRAAGGRAVAGFRDIVDEPEFVRRLWGETEVYDVLREHYDAICVYGTPEVIDFEADYGLEGPLAERLTYVGYLGLSGAFASGPSNGSPVVVASSGGGIDGGALLDSFISAAELVGPRLRSHLVVSGPLLAEKELQSLRRHARGVGIEIRRFESELDELIVRSDLVVMMPGYNSTCELVSGNARAIVVPRSGPSQEQRIRAEALTRWGRAVTLDPGELDPARLADAIQGALTGPPPPASAPVPLDGLARAVDLFESLAVGQPEAVGLS